MSAADSSAIDWRARPEVFSCGGNLVFNVVAAKHLLVAVPRPIVRVDLAPWRSMIVGGRILIDRRRVRADLARDDDAAHIDLDVPLIIATHPRWSGPIDGWHRMAKAVRRGLRLLPGVVLNEEETGRIRT